MHYFLGVDVGGTKTHAVVADADGVIRGFGRSGSGNPQMVGFKGLFGVLRDSVNGALAQSQVDIKQLSGSGFGIAGYDWPSDRTPMLELIESLGLTCPIKIVNDAVPGLVAGSEEGWGVSIISGTGCNCRGWDREHQREGRVTGFGSLLGEAAGASELVTRAMQIVNYSWYKRRPPTALSDAFIRLVGARSLDDLIEGYTLGRYRIDAEVASLVFEVAEKGDPQAIELIEWAGSELGEMVNGVVRQLGFETLTFDVVMSGGMFAGGKRLIESMRATIHSLAPGARLVKLTVPPVLGAVLIGMEQGGLHPDSRIRRQLETSVNLEEL